MRRSFAVAGVAVWLGLSGAAGAGTLVRLTTPVGAVTLELYDQQRPITVQNFLSYLKQGRFQSTFAHRLIPGFVLQGGGFALTAEDIVEVTSFGPIQNEAGQPPFLSNVKGTITMAKVGGDPNSATSQWFINLADNNTGEPAEGNLDLQNGGFTVFGRVVGDDSLLTTLNTDFADDDTATRTVVNAGGAFSTLPVLEFAGTEVFFADFVMTGWTILQEEKPTVSVAGRPRVRGTSAVLRGRVSAGVDRVEYRVNGARSLRAAPARPAWQVRVTRLKPGRNVVEVRAVTRSGGEGSFRRVVVRVKGDGKRAARSRGR